MFCSGGITKNREDVEIADCCLCFFELMACL